MSKKTRIVDFSALSESLDGLVEWDELARIAYSTDASVYRKKPIGVVYPKSRNDVSKVILFASENGISLIPRGGGTSLAGQCVGEGLVVDLSRFMNRILEINAEEGWALVEPGVIRDDLNRQAAQYGLFFGPNTSTANRCTIGGMVGNNSCGTTSIKYGTTRDKLLEVHACLNDGSHHLFSSNGENKNQEASPRGLQIESAVLDAIRVEGVEEEIHKHFPGKSIHRRNTGYAIDQLIQQEGFKSEDVNLNLCLLLAGSEGTLCMTTMVKVKLDKLPPPEVSVLCVHFRDINESMLGTVEAMKMQPYACELMDRTILKLTEENPEQRENRFFVEGDPGAILAVELRGQDLDELEKYEHQLKGLLSEAGLGYHISTVRGEDTQRVWSLRAAGLGVLSNTPGDKKPVAFVEDTAVDLKDLPAYIEEFQALMAAFNQDAVYYAHAGAGELHLRPILNLKSKKDRKVFREMAQKSAELVKKYNGSLSGEHGDGRVRAEFIELMVGKKNVDLFKKIKSIWDPENLFNPGKIVDPQPMDTDLRYEENQRAFTYKTQFNFGEKENMLQAAERCNGSGDCRKLEWTGATMCPSYQATRNEKDSTRARANVLRETLTRPENPAYPFDSEELKDVLDLCLSCKACKRECPSNVDMAALKAETMFHIQQRHGYSKRTKFFGNFEKNANRAMMVPGLVNALLKNPAFSQKLKDEFDIAPDRSIPPFSAKRASKVIKKYAVRNQPDLVLYIDEFTEFQDAEIALAAAQFFSGIGLKFGIVYSNSARAAISKGMLKEAKKAIRETAEKLKTYIDENIPVVGLEPSAVLGFRDEFQRLSENGEREGSKRMRELSFTFEEYVFKLMEEGRIGPGHFTQESKEVHVHLHCHQKALSHPKYSKAILGLPKNFRVRLIPSGCCGMAGSFGYEKEHYGLSMDIGELVLFPHIRKHTDVIIAAAGTSCRHQIKDGTSRESYHPAVILRDALKKKSPM
jgi:FAD/FMN-containing dehydrogenase/Fe-S oxidoreductase